MTALPPANSWVPTEPCSTGGDNNPSFVYGITITGTPAMILSPYAWSITLNDGSGPPNFTIDRYNSAGTLIDHPIEISGADGSTQFNDPVYLSRDPLLPMEAATKDYVDDGSLSANDVPVGVGVYGRSNVSGVGSWTNLAPPGLPYLPSAGGYLSGGVGLNGPVTQRFIGGVTPSPGNLWRWGLALGDNSAESGSNSGSNFVLTSYNDTGQTPTAQLTITRTGSATFPAQCTFPSEVIVGGRIVLAGPANLQIGGGNNGDVMMTNGQGGLLWGQASGGGGIPDAPIDANTYGRGNAAWTAVPAEAPLNASIYGRSNGGWTVLGFMATQPDAISISNQYYARYLGGWVNIGPNPANTYLPLTGSASFAAGMTGGVIFNGSAANRWVGGATSSSMRWAVNYGDSAAESSGNAGSNFTIQRFSDAGVTLDTPLTIVRSTGGVLLSGPLNGAGASFSGAVTVPTPPAADDSTNVATTAWVRAALPAPSTSLPPMDGTAAIGTSALFARADHVHPSDTSRLAIAGGTLSGNLSVVTASQPTITIQATTANQYASLYLAKNGTGQAQINGYNGAPGTAALRWNLALGDGTAESGGNAGSNFQLARYSDSGASLATALTITRSNGAVSMPGAVTVGSLSSSSVITAAPANGFSYGGNTGFGFIPGVTNGAASLAAYQGNQLFMGYVPFSNVGLTAPLQWGIAAGGGSMTAYYSSTASVTWTTTPTSDRRLKSAIEPSTFDALATINLIPVYSCEVLNPFPGAEPQHWDCAIIADEVEPLIPVAVNAPMDNPSMPDAIHYATINMLPLVNMLIKAVQQLTARVEALEAARG